MNMIDTQPVPVRHILFPVDRFVIHLRLLQILLQQIVKIITDDTLDSYMVTPRRTKPDNGVQKSVPRIGFVFIEHFPHQFIIFIVIKGRPYVSHLRQWGVLLVLIGQFSNFLQMLIFKIIILKPSADHTEQKFALPKRFIPPCHTGSGIFRNHIVSDRAAAD